MDHFPLFNNHSFSQQNQQQSGPWGGQRNRYYDPPQTTYPRQGPPNETLLQSQRNKNRGSTHAYFECMRNFQVHVETTLTRFHDLYDRKGRFKEAESLSEDGILSLMRSHGYDRVTATVQLLTETYQQCQLPQSGEALKRLLEWWEYLQHHRHPSREPSAGEVVYEQKQASAAKESAMELWKQYVKFVDDRGKWLDQYISESKLQEKRIHMELQVQALNAVDKDFRVELMQKTNPESFRFDVKRPTNTGPWQNPQEMYGNASLFGAHTLDHLGRPVHDDDLGHFEARKLEIERIMKVLSPYRPRVTVRGQSSEENQVTTGTIDTGNDGPNVVSLRFLSKLQLQSIMETKWTGTEQQLTLANGDTFRPIGWVPDLSFKFNNLPGGWHWASFWVADVKDYDIIIGMPCLLQDNIRTKLVAPLVSNEKQKKGDIQPSTPADQQDKINRAAKRREAKKQKDEVAEQQAPEQNNTTKNAFLGVSKAWQGFFSTASWADDFSDSSPANLATPSAKSTPAEEQVSQVKFPEWNKQSPSQPAREEDRPVPEAVQQTLHPHVTSSGPARPESPNVDQNGDSQDGEWNTVSYGRKAKSASVPKSRLKSNASSNKHGRGIYRKGG